MAYPAKLPNLNVINGRYIYRRRIPDRLRPLAAEVYGVGFEFTESLGSDRERAVRQYPAVMADVQAKLDHLKTELDRRSKIVSPLVADLARADVPFTAKQWAPLNLAGCKGSLEGWHRRDMLERYQLMISGSHPDFTTDKSAWFAWEHQRSELLHALRSVDVRHLGDVDRRVPSFTDTLLRILNADGHVLEANHPLLRPLLSVFRDLWIHALEAERRWSDAIILGQFPEPPDDVVGLPSSGADRIDPTASGAVVERTIAQQSIANSSDDHGGLTEASPFSALVRYYLEKRRTRREDVDSVSRRFVESLGEDKEIGKIKKKDIIRFRNLLEKMPAQLSASDRKLTLPQLAEKFGERVIGAVVSLQATGNDKGEDDNIDTNPEDIKPQADASIEKYLSIVKAMFALAADEDAISNNPAHRIAATKRGIVTERAPWDASDIEKLFSCEIFQGKVSNANNPPQVLGNSDYWLPIIAVLSGMRCEEIGQMVPSDIFDSQGIYVFSVSTLGESGKTIKRIKTSNARRVIPIHPTLIELGFLEYVEAVKQAKHSRLFPDLKTVEMKDGSIKFTKHYSSKRFTALRKWLGLTDPRKPFHSLRHTIKAAWKDAVVPDVLQDELLGHAGEGGAGKKYAKQQRAALSSRAMVIRSTIIPGMPVIKKPTSFGLAAIPRDKWEKKVSRQNSRAAAQ